MIKGCVDKANWHTLASGEKTPQIKRFVILNKELSANDGELTRSRKLRRDVIGQRYDKLVDTIYSGSKIFSLGMQPQHEDASVDSACADIKIGDAQIFLA